MAASAYTVLGSTGFIGKALVRELGRRGVGFWAPQRQSPDIFRRPLGVVFYCIGLTADYAQRPFDTVEAHVSYLARILEYADFEHIIYLSSTRLYDGLDIKLARGDTFLHVNPQNPRHLYDCSKALGENLCQIAACSRSSVARLSCVYDPGPTSPGFLSELLQRIRHERAFTLDSSPGYCRDYITLNDTVESLIAMGEQRACGTFNVASGVNTSNQEIADTLRPLGVDISFSREGGKIEQLPRADIEGLLGLGVSPAGTLSTLESLVRKLLI